MRKVLLTCVGDNDPLSSRKGFGSVVSLCEVLEPDLVYLFPSSRYGRPKAKSPIISGQEKGEDVRKVLMNPGEWGVNGYQGLDGASIRIRIIETDAPQSYREVAPKLRDHLRQVVAEIDEPVVWLVNVSSGTTAEKNLLSACATEICTGSVEVWQVGDPQYEPEKGESRIQRVEVRDSIIISSLPALVDHFRYGAVAELLTKVADIALDDERQKKAGALAERFRALALWDRREYGPATQTWRTRRQESEWERRVFDTIQTLSNVNDTGINRAMLLTLDGFENGERRYLEGEFGGALVIWWTVLETLLKYRVGAMSLQEEYDRTCRPDKSYPGVSDTYNWLIACNRDPGLTNLPGDFGKIAKSRNQWIHQHEVVTERYAVNAREYVLLVMQLQFPKINAVSSKNPLSATCHRDELKALIREL